jgi:hypothetical protein
MVKQWPYLLAIGMLLSAAFFIEKVSYGEELVAHKPFSQFPLQLTDGGKAASWGWTSRS